MDLSAVLNEAQEEEARPRVGKTEADAGRTTGTDQSLARLLRLPAELYGPIVSDLSNRDIKSLRLTSTFLHSVARLRLYRVFISAHQRDIQVLKAIADSEVFRPGVTELIWDDARFGRDVNGEGDDSDDQDKDGDDEEVPQWFQDSCNENIDELNSRKGLDADRAEHVVRAQQLSARLPPAVCWAKYQHLIREQDAVLASGADEAAFRHALRRFPSLKRITITPATHGWLFCPLYETPTIRGLPYGFNYPIPRGWPTAQDGDPPRSMAPWPADGEDEAYKEQWHGIRASLRVLADPGADHHVTELILDAHSLDTGLSCRIFDGPPTAGPGAPPNAEYALAPGMRHFSLRTDVVPDPDVRAAEAGSGGGAEHHLPLAGLADVLALLGALPPPMLLSVELSFLHFVDGGGSFRGLLAGLRDSWRARVEEEGRPAVAIGHALIVPRSGRAVWARREAVDGFLYGDGPNPLGHGEEDGFAPNQILMGGGAGVERDAFDPSHERPYVDNFALMRLGVLKKPPWLE